MITRTAVLLGCALPASGTLQGQAAAEPLPDPEYPLALNLPTADSMPGWKVAMVFTHRFVAPVKGHGKDAYGLDGMAYPGLGLDIGIKPVQGLNFQIYRTSDNKTVTFALQQQILRNRHFRMALRAERFDEVVDEVVTPLGSVGIAGGAFQLPTEFLLGPHVAVTLVPTYLTRTTTQEKGVFTAGAGVRVYFLENWGVMAEYYPRPSKLDSTFHSAFAGGITYKTYKHVFTLLGTNAPGTTAHQALGGDYGGGPRESDQWSLGFNMTRIF